MPYPTHFCLVIEPAVPFMEFIVQLESFDYSSLNIIDNQKRVYKIHHEEINQYVKPYPSKNYECTVKIDDVVNISVQKMNGSNELSLQTFLSICSNMIMIKDLMYF